MWLFALFPPLLLQTGGGGAALRGNLAPSSWKVEVKGFKGENLDLFSATVKLEDGFLTVEVTTQAPAT